jgi:hypothetical protein
MMHVEGVAYNKKTLKPLYGKLATYVKKKEIVLGDSYGLKTCYNILLRLFHVNIAPTSLLILMTPLWLDKRPR